MLPQVQCRVSIKTPSSRQYMQKSEKWQKIFIQHMAPCVLPQLCFPSIHPRLNSDKKFPNQIHKFKQYTPHSAPLPLKQFPLYSLVLLDSQFFPNLNKSISLLIVKIEPHVTWEAADFVVILHWFKVVHYSLLLWHCPHVQETAVFWLQVSAKALEIPHMRR